MYGDSLLKRLLLSYYKQKLLLCVTDVCKCKIPHNTQNQLDCKNFSQHLNYNLWINLLNDTFLWISRPWCLNVVLCLWDTCLLKSQFSFFFSVSLFNPEDCRKSFKMQSVTSQKAKKKKLSLFPSLHPHSKVLILNWSPCFGSRSLRFLSSWQQCKSCTKKPHLNSEQFKEITLIEEATDLLSEENPWFFLSSPSTAVV